MALLNYAMPGRFDDVQDNAFDVFQNIRREHAHSLDAVPREEGIARCIAAWAVAALVRFTVDLDA